MLAVTKEDMDEIDIKNELPWHQEYINVMQSQDGEELTTSHSEAQQSNNSQGLNFRTAVKTTKRKRKPDFTDGEQDALLESITRHRDVLANTTGGVARQLTAGQVKDVWGEVALQVYAVAPVHRTKRSVDELKNKWKQLKSLARKKRAAAMVASRNKSDASREVLGPREQIVLGLIGGRTVGGVDDLRPLPIEGGTDLMAARMALLASGSSPPSLPHPSTPPPDASRPDPLTPPPTVFVAVPMSPPSPNVEVPVPPPLPSVDAPLPSAHTSTPEAPAPSAPPPRRHPVRYEGPRTRRRRTKYQEDILDVANRQVDASNDQNAILSQILACLQSIATSLERNRPETMPPLT